MSIEDIIQESMNKNPLAVKKALEEELKTRIRAVLEAKCDDDEDEDEDEEEEDEKEEGKKY